MYKVFDTFLDADTWHTRHAEDDERFYRALQEVKNHKDFSPELMGEYFQSVKKVDRDNPNQKHLTDAIDKRVADGWAVCDYFKYAS